MSKKIRVFALGGLDEDGKNLYCVEIGEDIFVFDCGVKFPDKNSPGIDFMIPEFRYLKEHKDHIKAYILSHGHDDAIGALPYVYHFAPAPIYCTLFTKTYIELVAKNYKQDDKYDFHIIGPSDKVKIAGYNFQFFQTCHAIPQSFGVSLETEQGQIVYLTDYIVEYNQTNEFRLDLNAMGKVSEKETLLLMAESIGAINPGYTSPNHKIGPHLERAFKNAKGRIFVTLFGQSFYNIQEFINTCADFKRKVFLVGDTTKLLYDTFGPLGVVPFPKGMLESNENILRTRDQDVAVLIVGFDDQIYQDIAKLGNNELDPRIKLNENDTVVLGTPAPSSLEVFATDVTDDLYRSGATIVNIKKKDLPKMHAREEDIKMALSILKPKYYMPIKGYFRYLIANGKISVSMGLKLTHNNVFVIDNGMVLEAENGVMRMSKDIIETDDVLVDGRGIGDVVASVIMDRQKLSDDGVVILSATISKNTKEISAGPDIQMRGFIFVKDGDAIIRELNKVLINCIKEYQTSNMNFDKLKDNIHDESQKVVRRLTSMDPMILPLIFLI